MLSWLIQVDCCWHWNGTSYHLTTSTVTLGSGKNYQRMLSQEEKFFISNRMYVWPQNMSPKPTHQQQGEKLDNTLTRWTLSASRCNIWKGNITFVIFCLRRWHLKLNCDERSDLNGDHSVKKKKQNSVFFKYVNDIKRQKKRKKH